MGVNQSGVSQQIIEVFDHLAEKFGIVVNWGEQNVIPYIQEICSKYISWAICTSIVWLLVGVTLVGACAILIIIGYKWHKKYKDDYHYEGYGTAFFCVGGGFVGLVSIVVILTQIFDIVRCNVFPELEIYYFITNLMN